MEDTQPTHAYDDGTQENEKRPHFCLEKLIPIHNPVDLSEKVTIPDPGYRKAAKGGLADVHVGIYNGSRVCSIHFNWFCLYSISSGRR
jgi:hypothetical protein